MLVAKLAERGAQTRGFLETVRRLYEKRCGETDRQFSWLTVVPDAFVATDSRLLIYEVEVTSRCSENKLDQYVELYWVLDSEAIEVRLVLVDAHGRETRFDLLDWEFFASAERQDRA